MQLSQMRCWMRQVEDYKRNEGTRDRVQACIFKVGDDCRQDVLALQVVSLPQPGFPKVVNPFCLQR
jgi:phosphatidylinositol 4-kinase